MRVKRGVTARKRHKKLIKQTKGMGHARRSSPRKAREAVIRAQSFAYRDRRTRKRDFRRLWVTRINAAAREHGLTYGQFTAKLKQADIKLDRKILAELAVNHPEAFAEVIKAAQKRKPVAKTAIKK